MQRIEVFTLSDDGRAKTYEQQFAKLGQNLRVQVVDVYTLETPIEDQLQADSLIESFVNPVTQAVGVKPDNFDYAIEIGFLPGVTDNIGHTASELAALTLNDNQPIYSSRLILLSGDLNADKAQLIANDIHNPLIQRASIKSAQEYTQDNGMDIVVPKVQLDNKGTTCDPVDLNISDEDLELIGKDGIANADGSRRGPLGMSLLYMQAIQHYFQQEGRPANDIEIETLAQTWSEHCKHTIFSSPLDEIKDGVYRHYIKRATQEIRQAKGKNDFCVSVFKDNSGGIIFDDNWLITDKVETHNSPSALDPFGGAITGIVGVNRDCIGFGLGAKPALNRYGFCLADPRSDTTYYRSKGKTNPTLSAETVMKGVIHGVNVGGNCSGIPTPQGFVYFDDRYIGKPLVFAGTVGLIPREVNGKPAHEKAAQVGDKILMVGGKVGRDGIHGATFSSVALDEGSPATAVQIGDPITQKKFSDSLIKEIRDLGLYNAITDNGAGGLSSSVGEMAEEPGGFIVELENVPLKYPGMAPWEIWISESQERMTLAVPPQNIDSIQKSLKKRGVDSWVIGEFTNSGRAQIKWQNDLIMDLTMNFLHDGLPETPLETIFTPGGTPEPDFAEPVDYQKTLLAMLSRPNICSKEFVSTQYDHNVQGSAVLGPIQGKGRVCSDASVSCPVLTSKRGVVLSQGLFPRYSDIDTYHMATASLDFAVRAAVAAGCPVYHLAILDNFCWCSSDEPERLGQLKRACEAIYQGATCYGTPFISGKDSMFNDFKGYDANDNPVKISIPPTLLVSGIGVMEDVHQAISIDPKQAGDLIYLLGQTRDELGASEYYNARDALGQNVPKTNLEINIDLYQRLTKANQAELCNASLAVGLGGLGIALAKMCIASGLGIQASISSDMRFDKILFSETTGRVLVCIQPDNQKAFENLFDGFTDIKQIGVVTESSALEIDNLSCEIGEMEDAYKKTLRDY